jgi:hypothetical protein
LAIAAGATLQHVNYFLAWLALATASCAPFYNLFFSGFFICNRFLMVYALGLAQRAVIAQAGALAIFLFFANFFHIAYHTLSHLRYIFYVIKKRLSPQF